MGPAVSNHEPVMLGLELAYPTPPPPPYKKDLCLTISCFFIADKTFLAKPYLTGIPVYGKTVTCQDPDEHVPERFPAQTWTCRDMR